MPVKVQMSNVSQQLHLLGQGLSADVRAEWEKGAGEMVDEMGDVLDERIQRDVFDRSSSPTGVRWTPYSELSKRVYAETGRQLKQGGTKMRRSFQIGGAGNLWRKRKFGFVLGSALRASGHLVARTFQTAFKVPRSAGDEEKAGRVRAWMGRTVGIHAPAPGRQLKHPARRILQWVPKWERAMMKVAELYLARAIKRGNEKTKRKVESAQKMLDAGRRS